MAEGHMRASGTGRTRSRLGRVVVGAVAIGLALALAGCSGGGGSSSGGSTTTSGSSAPASDTATVWLCRPGAPSDPCVSNQNTITVSATGAKSPMQEPESAPSTFDCFYVYPTVSPETSTNADLTIQPAEIATAVEQASRFSTVCRVWAPMYRQVTLAGLARSPGLDVPAAAGNVAYDSLRAAFSDYLAHDNDGRPIVFIGHSQGAAMLIELLSRLVDGNAALRDRLVLAIILGGDVEVPTGGTVGGSFAHIPVCTGADQAGCVIAYSTFPSEPPSSALFGRPGQGVALQSGQTRTQGVQVACVNPAAVGGGSGALLPLFRQITNGSFPWRSYPGLYTASCQSAGGATWLQVTKATGPSDPRPTVQESEGPDWGYHGDDVNLALGNLVLDVAHAETAWSTAHPS